MLNFKKILSLLGFLVQFFVFLKDLFKKKNPPVANPQEPQVTDAPKTEPIKEEPPKQELAKPQLPPAKKELWYPNAIIPKEKMKTAGKYRKGYPEGAIVHFTAGHGDTSGMDYGRKMGYCFFLIDAKGKVYQSFPLDQWGYHAGESSWPTLGNGVSQYLVGIEVAAAGKVTKIEENKYKTWFNTFLTKDQVRYSPKKDNIQEGFYQKYTDAQESALFDLLMWLKCNNPDVFAFDHVLGHDEVAPKRKNDPGAALAVSMPEYRKSLKQKFWSLGGK